MRIRRLLSALALPLVVAVTLSSCGQSTDREPAPRSGISFTDITGGTSLEMTLSEFTDVDGEAILAKAVDPKLALEAYLAGTYTDCSRTGEFLGRSAAQTIDRSAFVAFAAKGTDFCGGAYARGLYTGQFIGKSVDELKGLASESCTTGEERSAWVCSYFLGRASANAGLADPLDSLEVCLELDKGSGLAGDHITDSRSCLSGFWAQFYGDQRIIEAFSKANLAPDIALSLCMLPTGDARDVCLQEIYPVFWAKSGAATDNEPLFRACHGLKDANLVDQCYFGMGRGVAVVNRLAVVPVINACSELTDTADHDYCLIAAGEALDSQSFAGGIPAACGSQATSEANDSCYRSLGLLAFGLRGGDISAGTKDCELVAGTTATACRDGAWAGRARIGFVRGGYATADAVYSVCRQPGVPGADSCVRTALTGSGDLFERLGGLEAFTAACGRFSTDGILLKACQSSIQTRA